MRLSLTVLVGVANIGRLCHRNGAYDFVCFETWRLLAGTRSKKQKSS